MTLDKQQKLVRFLKAFLLINSEAGALGVQKLVERLDDKSKEAVYKLVTEDLRARVNNQMQNLEEELKQLKD